VFYYRFLHRLHGDVEIGPFNNEYEAKLTFQQRYGYWPENAVEYNTYPKIPIHPDQW
jgi:hypothetical protein